MTTKNNIPTGYKDSAVGIIPQEWEVKRLGLVCNFLDNQRVPIKDVDRLGMHGPYPYYGASGIIDYVNDYIFDDELILLGEDGANIINRSTPLAFMVEGKIWVNNHAHVLRPIEPNNRFYICSYLESISYDKYNTGTAQPKLNREVCEKILIPVPPMEEQRKIAEILGVWDEAIEKQSRLIEKLELRKRALMQRLLTGRTRLSGFTTPWQKVKLGEIFKERNETKCEHLPLLSITAERGVILQSESDKKDTSNDDKSKYKRICPNDIGYNTMRMWQGRSALSAMEGIVSPAYTIVTPKVEVDPLLISELIKQPRVVYDFWTHSQGLVGDTLNCKFHDFSQVKVAIPSLPEQKAIAEVLTTADYEIATHRKKLEALRLQKRGLMQQLLIGKIRVKI